MASPPPSASGGHLLSNNVTNYVKKFGYLKKQKHGHRRFFVLKEHTDCFPARLEYYETEKKWRNRSAAKRVITLDSCLCVNKRADAKHKHLIALYTKDEYFAVAAENEQEQESWYEVLTDLIAEGKVYDSPASTSSLVGFEEANYGVIAPNTAAYKEVWQVNLKSKGLGQSKNLVGVYRLCLSSRTISFVKLNCDVAAVTLQLMNVRRCGHSDTFFFIEVGRSAVTGPGEFWMQAEDSVVAQNIHETILEAMKAMKELAEFRPRSKSQSASSTNPILVPTRRHLTHLPPSQTGLVRRARTDSISTTAAGTSPARKLPVSSSRVRTASEGDGGVGRPASMCLWVCGPGPSSLGQLVRSHTVSSGRTCRMLEASSPTSSAPPPLDDSPPSSVGSSLSASPRRRPLSALSTPDRTPNAPPPSGSLGDGGFLSCDEYGSPPTVSRLLPMVRCDTPDSLPDTTPSLGPAPGTPYMVMEAGPLSDAAYRKRTYSLTTPRQQRLHAPQPSSASLDEYTLMKAGASSSSYPEDYGHVEVGSSSSSSSSRGSCGNLGDEAGCYMPMTAQGARVAGGYVSMSPACVSAPKKILYPRTPPHWPAGSPDDAPYVKMSAGSSPHAAPPPATTRARLGDQSEEDAYVSMTPGLPPHGDGHTPPDSFPSPQDSSRYMEMRPGARGPTSGPSPPRQGSEAGQRGRLGRPVRLALEAVRTLPSMTEHPAAAEPRSPGEYVNIDFSRSSSSTSSSSSSSPATQSHGRAGGGGRRTPLSDYMNLRMGAHSPQAADTPVTGHLVALPESSSCPCSEDDGSYHLEGEGCSDCEGGKEDYTVMTLGLVATPPQLVPQSAERELRLSPDEPRLGQRSPGLAAFLLGSPSDPDRVAKVIRADPQGRRRHSSETFSSTATVTPVCPSFAPSNRRHEHSVRPGDVKRHSSAENVSSRSSEGSDDEAGGADYTTFDLRDGGRDLQQPRDLITFRTTRCCKGDVNGLLSTPYGCLGFSEAATTAKD